MYNQSLYIFFLYLIGFGNKENILKANGETESDDVIPLLEIFNKAKRMPGSGFTRVPDSVCPTDCLRTLKNQLETDPELNRFVKSQFKPYRFSNQFEPVMTTKYCRKVNATIECVSECASSMKKAIAQKALSIPQYICYETRFVDYSACYKRINDEMEPLCHTRNKCGPKKAELENAMNVQPTSMNDVKNMMEVNCNYLSCFNQCDRGKMIQECGKDANNVLMGLYKRAMEVSQNMFQSVGMEMELPPNCKKIGIKDDSSDETN